MISIYKTLFLNYMFIQNNNNSNNNKKDSNEFIK